MRRHLPWFTSTSFDSRVVRVAHVTCHLDAITMQQGPGRELDRSLSSRARLRAQPGASFGRRVFRALHGRSRAGNGYLLGRVLGPTTQAVNTVVCCLLSEASADLVPVRVLYCHG